MLQNKQKTNQIAKVSALIAIFSIFVFSGVAVYAEEAKLSTDVIIRLANEARVSAGVEKVLENRTLDEAAKQKATDMINNGYFAHTSPDGKTPWYWFDKNGYDYIFAGENLAINFKNPQDQQRAWMESPLHKKNILNPKYAEIGVASIQGMIDGHVSNVTVQLFGTPASKEGSATTKEENKSEDIVEPANVGDGKIDSQNEQKPIVLSIEPANINLPPSSPNYAGVVAAGSTFLALALVLLTDTIIVLRKRKMAHDLHQGV